MDGYIGLFLETGNPTFYMMSKQNEQPKAGAVSNEAQDYEAYRARHIAGASSNEV